MKIYLSGKMTGLSKKKIWNNFQKIEKYLCKRGIVDGEGIDSVMNPAVTYAMRKFDAFSYEDWLHIDFAMIDACDAIVLLPNWEDSIGAKREITYAYKHGKEVLYPTLSFAPRNEHNKKFKFNGEKYNAFEINPELTKRVAIGVETHDLRKETQDLIDSFIEKIATEKLASEIEE